MAHPPGPWEYVPSTEHHGPYVSNGGGYGDICDCYVMTIPTALSVRNGGDSRPVHMQHDEADANARLIAAAPDLLAACKAQHQAIDTLFAMLIDRSPPGDTFHPSKSGALWDACVAGNAAIAKAEGTS